MRIGSLSAEEDGMTGATTSAVDEPRGLIASATTALARLVVSIVVPIVAFIVLYIGFTFLRDSNAPKLVIVGVAIVWGIGGVWMLYWVANWTVERLPKAARGRILPFVFVGPAMAILAFYLLIPTVITTINSFKDANSVGWVGFANYIYAFTNSDMLIAIRNNVIWLVLGTTLSTGFGLAVAVLADRSRLDRVAKTLIFLPMAISFVGAGIIWRFVFSYQPEGQAQIGLLNGILGTFGLGPVSWLTGEPLNTVLLILILVWGQTGYAMVILGAALKGVSDDLLEAGRIDGATEWQIFRRIIVPSIWPTIVTVATTIAILTLKIFDVVYAMTGGAFKTDVIATLQFKQMFGAFDYGKGSALAIVLLIAVSPVIIYNLRQFRSRSI
jgi:alpha-glucoside transport system permease protein